MRKYTKLATLACMFTVVSSTSLFASQVCPNGRMTQGCLDHLNITRDTGKNFVTCINELLDEYQGWNGTGAGKGRLYRAKKQKCMDLAQYVIDDIKMAAPAPGADTSDKLALEHAMELLDSDEELFKLHVEE